MNFRKLTELLLMTGTMAFFMSSAMTIYNFGFNEQAFKIWTNIYPVAWAVAIPAIMVTRKFVGFLMGMLFRTITPSRSV